MQKLMICAENNNKIIEPSLTFGCDGKVTALEFDQCVSLPVLNFSTNYGPKSYLQTSTGSSSGASVKLPLPNGIAVFYLLKLMQWL